MSIRKLASIQRILSLDPIPEADRIEVATIKGWKVVVNKGLHQVGDLVAYFEIDAWIPTSLAPFLTKEGHEPKDFNGIKGERLRTVRLRGQLSQGLILPVIKTVPEKAISNAILFYDAEGQPHHQVVQEGQDVTELLGVVLYEPEVGCVGQARGTFPGGIRQTDQERIQNLTDYFQKHTNLLFEVTIKLDGTSMTVYRHDDDLGVCSRKQNLREFEETPDGPTTTSNTYWRTARRNKLLEALTAVGRNLAIQGELIGEGIQSNREGLKGHEFFCFDIWDIDQGRYLTRPERTQTLETLRDAGATITEVPVLHEAIYAFQTWPTLADMLQAAEGASLHGPIREGLVFKSTELVNGEPVTFKAISNAYLELLEKKSKRG